MSANHMSLVFAAIVPHPPLLIPSIGKESVAQLTETQQGFERLEQDLYLAKPDIIVIISPHEGLYEDTFVVNAHTKFHSSYKEFGDVVTTEEWHGATDVAAKIGHVGNRQNIPTRLISEEELSHGASIPLHFLTKHLRHVQILPIGFSNLEPKKHIAFGEMLKDVIMDQNKRVAIIASGDLAHTHTKQTPAGFDETGALFDKELMTLLETRNTAGIIQLNPIIVTAAQECGYRSLLILLGMIKEMDYQFKTYSYEYPFGVGYLVGNFVL